MIDLILIAAATLPVGVFLAIAAWKLWRGHWLRFIAGNTFAASGGLRSRRQLRLGRDVAKVLVLAALAIMLVPLVFGLSQGGGPAFVVCVIAEVLLIVGAGAIAVAAVVRYNLAEMRERGEWDDKAKEKAKFAVIQWVFVALAGLTVPAVAFAGRFLGWY